jgi:tartrate dehydrogenase/decarboxylase/D-malate dehydrogenase
MMLDHLGYPEAGAAIVTAIETVLTTGPRTRDIGGTANTVDVGKAIAEAVAGS